MAAWSVVAGTIVLLGVIALLMARQGSPGALSEQHGRPSRQAHVVDRPADAGAEPMDLPASQVTGPSTAGDDTDVDPRSDPGTERRP